MPDPDLVELLVELVQLRRLGHLVLVHEEWWLDLFVVFLAQKVQGICDQSLVEIDTIVGEIVSSVTSHLGT